MKAIVAKNYFGGFSKVGMKNKFRSVRPITEIPVVMVMMKSILFFSVELMLSKADLYEDNFWLDSSPLVINWKNPAFCKAGYWCLSFGVFVPVLLGAN